MEDIYEALYSILVIGSVIFLIIQIWKIIFYDEILNNNFNEAAFVFFILFIIIGIYQIVISVDSSRNLFLIYLGLLIPTFGFNFYSTRNWGQYEKYKSKIKNIFQAIILVGLLIGGLLSFFSVLIWVFNDVIISQNQTTIRIIIGICLLYGSTIVMYNLHKFVKNNPKSEISKLLTKISIVLVVLLIVLMVIVLPLYQYFVKGDNSAGVILILLLIPASVILITFINSKFRKK